MRLRFSLRALLIVIATIGLIAGVIRSSLLGIYDRAERHRRAVAVFDDGIYARKDWSTTASPEPWNVRFVRTWIHPNVYDTATFLHLSSNWAHVRQNIHELQHLNGLHDLRGEISSLSLQEAKALCEIPELDTVILSVYESIEPGALAQLASAPKLEQFWIVAPVTDLATFEAIANSRTLKSVAIGGKQVSAVELAMLEKCSTIEKLLLDKINVTRQSLEPLKKLPRLREIEFTDCEVTAEGMGELSRLPLTSISFAGRNAVLQTSLAPLARSNTLEALIVHAKCPQTEGELAAFRHCTKLKRLILPKYHIMPNDLLALGGSPSLDVATFTGDVSDQEIQAFIDRKPGRTLKIKPLTAESSATN